MHLLRGNVGSGVFAMGDAFHHAGIVVAPVLTLLLAAACVHSQHILVRNTRSIYPSGFSLVLFIAVEMLVENRETVGDRPTAGFCRHGQRLLRNWTASFQEEGEFGQVKICSKN